MKLLHVSGGGHIDLKFTLSQKLPEIMLTQGGGQTLRKGISYLLLAVFITFGTGCESQLLEPSALTAEDGESIVGGASAIALSGEDIFRGIAMGEGDVAMMIPEIRDTNAIDHESLSEEASAGLKDFNGELIEVIRSTQPSFFDDFGEMMSSGNHITVMEGLDKAGAVLLDAVYEIPEVQELIIRIEEEPEYVDYLVADLDDVDTIYTEDDIKQMLYLFAAGDIYDRDPSDEVGTQFITITAGPAAFWAAFIHTVGAVHIAVVLTVGYQAGIAWNLGILSSKAVGMDLCTRQNSLRLA